jgi:two-component system, chemotaxis family, response regulator Rcp1
MKLFLVDDSQDELELLRLVIKRAGLEAELTQAANGESAFRMLKEDGFRPDLMMVDLNMPRVDGFELMKKIRGDEELTYIPILMFSGSATEGDVMKAYRLHVNGFISKPLDLDRYREVMQHIFKFWFEIVKLPTRLKI